MSLQSFIGAIVVVCLAKFAGVPVWLALIMGLAFIVYVLLSAERRAYREALRSLGYWVGNDNALCPERSFEYLAEVDAAIVERCFTREQAATSAAFRLQPNPAQIECRVANVWANAPVGYTIHNGDQAFTSGFLKSAWQCWLAVHGERMPFLSFAVKFRQELEPAAS